MFLCHPTTLSISLLFLWLVLAPDQQLVELQRRFSLQKGSVQRAQFFSRKLGPAQISALADLYRTGQLEAANAELQSYVEQIARLADELNQAVRDPERHSGGFKPLEVHLRGAILRLRDVSTSLPYSDRDELKKQIDRLERLRFDLFAKLFPRTGAAEKEKPR